MLNQETRALDLESISPVLHWAGREKYPKGISVGPRRLPYYEIIFFHQGRGTVRIEKEIFPFTAGDLFIVCPDQEHVYASEDTLVDHDYLCFSVNPLPSNQPSKIGADVRVGLSRTKWVMLPVKVSGLPSETASLFQELIFSIKAKRTLRADFSVLLRKRRMLELFEWILATQPPSKDLEPFLRSRNYIDQHLEKKILVSTLASLEGLTANYYSSRFQKIFGLSLTDYLLERRISHARRLFIEGKKVNEVARLSGPWDSFYFSRVFKAITGFTPKHYRELVKRTVV